MKKLAALTLFSISFFTFGCGAGDPAYVEPAPKNTGESGVDDSDESDDAGVATDDSVMSEGVDK